MRYSNSESVVAMVLRRALSLPPIMREITGSLPEAAGCACGAQKTAEREAHGQAEECTADHIHEHRT
eukprot:CAMPEP_0114634336 /NCGR_PEP_ID=MMETSP0168-20121206/15927_1 /TAXON_ID=95228 ORGANISM="Vannella sp., Strain DIVA3 517/6/12" /NCGR_SAMPLE_ID=MMETSP0168 /ASSEMBLY_ACC=CAM_ASM_000044 /LENGTH=66 /DNA_ID=CAMNT_0001846033 /DNA_START=315 /DNA_END=511 /DNA_ORIENTATION=-